MKTLTHIKIGIITLLVIVSNVTLGNNTPVKEVKVSNQKSTPVKPSTKQQDLTGSKRGILPTMTVTTSTKTYLV